MTVLLGIHYEKLASSYRLWECSTLFKMNGEIEQVLQDVRDAIRADERFATTFEPFSEGLHQEGDFWFVPVRLQKFEPADRRMQLYVQFAKLESYLQVEKHLDVVLLPVVNAMTA